MSKPDQLHQVVATFEQWRLTKNSRQTITPALLRQQAVALLDTYSSSKITSALKLSGAQLKRWAGPQVDEQPPVFVQLPPVAEPAPSSSVTPHSIALHFRHGGQLLLSGDISPAQLGAIVREMQA